MRALVAIGLSLSASAASAADLKEQIYSCWSVPAGFEQGPPPLSFDVKLDGSGAVQDVTFIGEKPSDPTVEKLIRSSSLAIQRCSPYVAVKVGTQRVTLDLRDILDAQPEIDPLK
ncbi:hypothetical protein NGM99_13715 [Mesorhizobium sp. RP14(2022)]|uniref:TonB C-terminal domain-containing protein n=1 Tax=Mesorhizobium liriopis TaxID=2953882 RepID=A0ABT1C9K1_9HYPH|nr:hypothetical protein [Mesorhizobium liriopis]MCO6050836.1 hypothetical protein [Mesorhizobium liriopis]